LQALESVFPLNCIDLETPSEIECAFKNVILRNPGDKVEINLNGKNSSRIHTINFRASKLSYMPNEIFENFANLNTLKFQNVDVDELSSKFFANRTSLSNIRIMGSNVKSIAKGSFAGIRKYITLYMNNNEIGSIDEGAFEGLENLGKFDFSNSVIKTVNKGFLEFLVKHRSGQIFGNRIGDVDSVARILKNNNDSFYRTHEKELARFFENWNEIVAKMKEELFYENRENLDQNKTENPRKTRDGTKTGTKSRGPIYLAIVFIPLPIMLILLRAIISK
jgi:hypothetical protein